MSFADIEFKLSTQLSLLNLSGVQTFQAVAEVMSLALGGKKNDGPTSEEVDRHTPKTADEAIAMFAKVMSGG